MFQIAPFPGYTMELEWLLCMRVLRRYALRVPTGRRSGANKQAGARLARQERPQVLAKDRLVAQQPGPESGDMQFSLSGSKKIR